MPRRVIQEENNDLNLVPIMNLVLILIPLLLLSIVFMEITVINVTMPQKSFGRPNADGEEPKRLQVIISKNGFFVMKGDQAMPPIPSCASKEVTICLADATAQEPVEKYDWLALYNLLMELKADDYWKDHEQIELVAGPDITYGVLVKAMDVSRYQRVNSESADAVKGTPFSDLGVFWGSKIVRVEAKGEDDQIGLAPVGLFPLVVLGLPTTR